MVASFSISGVPPFNGFVSKWLIYQGLISKVWSAASRWELLLCVLCLIAAMFGSALTLASFIKLLHAVFLGPRLNSSKIKHIGEAPWTMLFPCLVLAVTCIIFGVLAYALPLKYFIFPAVSAYVPISAADLTGSWSPVMATCLILAGLIFGFVFASRAKLKTSLRQDDTFDGGEVPSTAEESYVTGEDFYNTIKELKPLEAVYRQAGRGRFDIYEQSKHIFTVSKAFQFLHNGVLPTYLVWILLGMLGLFFVLMK
jgi:NADH:ubiquinone oxidoreductase subunit 5 (subunit L)/multisubunit Na+/H+ antiporter MnhA subunit